MKTEDRYYAALMARDPRFDGKFFVGVKTTGIYCRPICPARAHRKNVEFFSHRLQAEQAGYRPCLRCRPEAAPGSAAWVGKSAVVRRAFRWLQARPMSALDSDDFADRFGVSARHLRRLFVEELGKTPSQILAELRLMLAHRWICETSRPITEIALSAGFRSIRRFNDAFKARFACAPREVRVRKRPVNAGERTRMRLQKKWAIAGTRHDDSAAENGIVDWQLLPGGL